MIPSLNHDRMTALIMGQRIRNGLDVARVVHGIVGKAATIQECRESIDSAAPPKPRKPGRPALSLRPGYCYNGHPLSGKNLHITPKGFHKCRTCLAERQARSRLAKVS